MADPIQDSTLGERLVCEGDIIWDGEVINDSTTLTSPAFLLANTLGRQAVVLKAKEAVDWSGGDLTIQIQTSDTEGGTYTRAIKPDIVSYDTFAAGETIFTWIAPPETTKMWTRIWLSSFSQSPAAAELDAYIIQLA